MFTYAHKSCEVHFSFTSVSQMNNLKQNHSELRAHVWLEGSHFSVPMTLPSGPQAQISSSERDLQTPTGTPHSRPHSAPVPGSEPRGQRVLSVPCIAVPSLPPEFVLCPHPCVPGLWGLQGQELCPLFCHCPSALIFMALSPLRPGELCQPTALITSNICPAPSVSLSLLRGVGAGSLCWAAAPLISWDWCVNSLPLSHDSILFDKVDKPIFIQDTMGWTREGWLP